MNNLAIIGAGNAGTTIAAHLKKLGQKVSLFDVVESQLKPIIQNNNTINLTGNINITGEAKIDLITMDLAEAVDNAEIIICTTPAHVHKIVARNLAPILKDGQIIVLNPGRTGGVLEVRKILKEQNCKADVTVVETQTILYACRKTDATVKVFGTKQHVTCAGLPKKSMPNFFKIIQSIFPEFIPSENGIWGTSLNNIGMLFHPTPTLLNLGRMESQQEYDYYIEGVTPSIAYLIEKLDIERLNVAKALGIKLPTVIEWLKSTYNTHGNSLHKALQNNQAYYGIKAPKLVDINAKKSLRYVVEDVPTGLVPVSELGKKLGILTPAIDTIISIANLMFDTDFRAIGRTLKQLGLENMSLEEIKRL